MESGTRKKRTLAERRESDKLRQRRFRAKKREQALLLKALSGEVEEEEKEKKQPTVSRKTADEIRETNRIRQQRFRAKKRGEEPMEELPLTPLEFVLQTEQAERDRQTEVRREKDRIRKRRERQRKKERGASDGVFSVQEAIKMTFQHRLEQLEEEMTPSESTEIPQKQQAVTEKTPEACEEEIDSTKFIAELEKMGFQIGISETDGSPILENKTESLATSSESSSSPPSPLHASSPFLQELIEFIFSEKKPWQRCHTSEERRQRERMRKRMYRAKQKFLSTGILDMQWDPSPIKRTPNDVSEVGITPIPEWTKNLSSEQKLAAHRIYNKRYRERIRVNAATAEVAVQRSPAIESEEPSMETDLSSLPPEIYTEILTIISQCDLSSLIAQNA